MRLARVLRIVRDLSDQGIRLCVLALQARHEHSALAVGVENESHRPFGRHERETDVVEDVGGVEQRNAVQALLARMLRELRPPLPILGLLDPHAARSFSRQSGSSSRSRRTRSPTGGWVTKSAAKPTSMNGLMV